METEQKYHWCDCHKCNELNYPNVVERNQHVWWMVVCPLCGNKRCPKASDHTLNCTNSNEPGQEGSIFI